MLSLVLLMVFVRPCVHISQKSKQTNERLHRCWAWWVTEFARLVFLHSIISQITMGKPAPRRQVIEKPQSFQDFEEVLSHVGGWGRYQIVLLFFFFAFCAFTAYIIYAPVLFLYVPDHWCKPHPTFENSSLSPEAIARLTIPLKENGEREQCVMYNITLQEV